VKYNHVVGVRVKPVLHGLAHSTYFIEGRGMEIRPPKLLNLRQGKGSSQKYRTRAIHQNMQATE